MTALQSPLFIATATIFAVSACKGTVGSSNGAVGPGNITVQVICNENGSAAPAPIRRLTRFEYANAAAALLGIDTSSAKSTLPDDAPLGEFDNNVTTQDITEPVATAYANAAGELSTALLANTAARDKLIGCNLASDASCLNTFLLRFLKTAYRRPPSDTELTRMQSLADTARAESNGDVFASVGWVIEAVLQSPNFFLRPEVGSEGPDSNGRVKLSPFEIATRLAFTLWGTSPDDALMASAASGELGQKDGLVARVNTMLADPRAKQGLENFYSQWLHLNFLKTFNADTTLYPTFNDAVRTSMLEEVKRLTEYFMWTENEDFLNIYTSNKTFIDANLASIYQVPAPTAPFDQITLPVESQRAGLLGTAGVLALNSKTDQTSIVFRGKFLRNVVLCDIVPPPAVAVVPPPVKPGESSVAAFAAHGSKPECIGCHQKLDPIGLGLERYNVIGALRTKDQDGFDVSMSGEVKGLETPAFAGVVELGEHVRASSMTAACVPKQFMNWATGRTLDDNQDSADACNRNLVSQRFNDKNHSFLEMVRALVTSEGFTYRQYDSP